MTKTHKGEAFLVKGVFHLADDLDLHDDSYYRMNAEMWATLPAHITTRYYEIDDIEYTITADWSSAKDLTQKAFEVVRNTLTKEKETGRFEWQGDYPNEITVPIIVSSFGDHSKESQSKPKFMIENYLYDVFFILNVALPGSADFMNLIVEDRIYKFETKLDIASYYPHRAYIDEEWPILSPIDVSKVEQWYSSVRSGASQVPENMVESAIFALLHVCRSNGKPEDIIWMFYAFESLFKTRAGENFSAITERIRFILDPNPKQEGSMKKKLREMYNFRSSFVHGGLKVIHPLHNEQIDSRINELYDSIVELTQYGVKLLLACFQTYIKNGWLDVEFEVTARPIKG